MFLGMYCRLEKYRCFAATMDSKEGVILDNFSTRGSSGQQLVSIPLSILKAYNRLRTYDLIVLQYGLNVASENVSNYSYYTHEMEKVVRHLKEAFPEAAILIIGIGDRENKTETGELRTMPGVKISSATSRLWLQILMLLFGICSKRWEVKEVW